MNEQDRARFAVYSARRLLNAVSADVRNRVAVKDNKGNLRGYLDTITLRRLKTKVIFSIWDDMIEIGEGDVADRIIEGK